MESFIGVKKHKGGAPVNIIVLIFAEFIKIIESFETASKQDLRYKKSNRLFDNEFMEFTFSHLMYLKKVLNKKVFELYSNADVGFEDISKIVFQNITSGQKIRQ